MKRSALLFTGLMLIAMISVVDAQNATLPDHSGSVTPILVAPLSVSGDVYMAFAPLKTKLAAQGYDVKFEQSSAKQVALAFTKVGKTAGKGLLGVKWNMKLEGTAKYYFADDGWVYVSGDIVALEKPPVIGDWTSATVDSGTAAALTDLFAKYSRVATAERTEDKSKKKTP